MKYGVYVLMFFVGGGYALIKTWQTSASVWMKILWTFNILLMPLASLAASLVARRTDEDSPAGRLTAGPLPERKRASGMMRVV